MEGDTLITNENLFDVPPEKEDKRTADEEMSPKLSEENDKHQVKPESTIKAEQGIQNIRDKSAITDYFYFDQSLGLPTLTDADIERKDLARDVLQFMWVLCQDDAVYGVIEP